ncbi:uncharacterized protein LOC125222099 isoform X2 [Salvia hispanica]|uniref:uncharacterized protein LOC125222099 isoform X2 n=1 Tax=Salvia hispanica TaxID=49212 RepID=UPI0020093824|nr:uncharacterized protein LOC125222099 isoform X2 [Salvia hispanica]
MVVASPSLDITVAQPLPLLYLLLKVPSIWDQFGSELICGGPNNQKADPSSTTNDNKPPPSSTIKDNQPPPSSTTNDCEPPYVDETSEVLQESQLQSVASSNEIRDLVKNEKLQKLIHSIDCSADPESELDKAMEEESFSQFAEKILSTIVPDA